MSVCVFPTHNLLKLVDTLILILKCQRNIFVAAAAAVAADADPFNKGSAGVSQIGPKCCLSRSSWKSQQVGTS
jgi:hypothetical protein